MLVGSSKFIMASNCIRRALVCDLSCIKKKVANYISYKICTLNHTPDKDMDWRS